MTLFKNNCPIYNPHQGVEARMLFVCSIGMLRSPTGAVVGANFGYNTRSCGANQKLALIPLSENLIRWADHIAFVHKDTYDFALNLVRYNEELSEEMTNKSFVLNIQDIYGTGDIALVRRLKDFFEEFESLDLSEAPRPIYIKGISYEAVQSV